MQLRVRFRDTDSSGRIFFTKFLEYFDDETIEFFRQHGITLDPQGRLYIDGKLREGETMVVGECYLRLFRPVTFDDLLDVKCEVKEMGERKIVLGFKAQDKDSGELCAEGYKTLIYVHTKKMKSMKILAEVKTKLGICT